MKNLICSMLFTVLLATGASAQENGYQHYFHNDEALFGSFSISRPF